MRLICLTICLMMFCGSLQAAEVKLAPYRAIYQASLDSAPEKSGISSVKGVMLMDLADTCAGWTLQQSVLFHVADSQDKTIDINVSSDVREAKDGTYYNFNYSHVLNGKETQRYKGYVMQEKGKGQAVYSLPENKASIKLPDTTIFPTRYTRMVLEQIKEGKRFFAVPVFDGSDKEGYADISTFIGEPRDVSLEGVDKDLAGNPLIQSKVWPVRVAFFMPVSKGRTPKYEMDMDLQENGIAQNVYIDYGAFRVKGTLKRLEPQEKTLCPQ